MATDAAVRMNISVPHSLKRDMDAVDSPVNWSAVAADAFRDKLLEIASRRGARTIDEVVRRLKAAQARETNANYRAGKAAGEKWARDGATPRQLRKMAKAAGEGFEFMEDPAGVRQDAVRVAEIVINEGEVRWRDLARYESYLSGIGLTAESMEDKAYLEGFVAGATELWEKVSGKL